MSASPLQSNEPGRGGEAHVARRNLTREPLWAGRGPLLQHLDAELTERCNNTCIHCYINLPAGDRRAEARELTTDAWQDILRQAADLGALSVRFTGGEPLLRPDFADLYLYARRLGLKVVVFTNARLITPRLAALFARTPPLHKIQVTVYGMRAESYESVTGIPGAYAQFRRGVDLLLEHRVPFIVKASLLPQNRDEMAELEAWAKTIPWMEGPPAYTIFFELRGRRDSEARNRTIAALRLSAEEELALLARDPDRYRREVTEFCARSMGPPGDRLFSCGAGREGAVDAYGRYQPCLLLRAPELAYDLRSGSLREALESFFPQQRDAVRATNPEYLARCARCFLKGLCEQCPAKSWAEHGTLDTPVEHLCAAAHAKARFLGLITDEERAWEVEDGRERVRVMAESKPGDRAGERDGRSR